MNRRGLGSRIPFLALVIALGISLAGSAAYAAGLALPGHRGPLKPGEMKAIVNTLRATTVRSYRAAGKRLHESIQSGRPFNSTQYEVLEAHGYKYLVEKGKGTT